MAWWKARIARPCCCFFYIPHAEKKSAWKQAWSRMYRKQKNPLHLQVFSASHRICPKEQHSCTRSVKAPPEVTVGHKTITALECQQLGLSQRLCAAHRFRGLFPVLSSTDEGQICKDSKAGQPWGHYSRQGDPLASPLTAVALGALPGTHPSHAEYWVHWTLCVNTGNFCERGVPFSIRNRNFFIDCPTW